MVYLVFSIPDFNMRFLSTSKNPISRSISLLLEYFTLSVTSFLSSPINFGFQPVNPVDVGQEEATHDWQVDYKSWGWHSGNGAQAFW